MTIRIKLEIIAKGISLALEKAEQHFSSAEALVSMDSLDDAIILIEFGIEEFGRAVALREKLKQGSEEIEKDLLRSHKYKYDKAWSVLPQELKTIYQGNFDPAIFDPRIFDAGRETISPATRLDAGFVNYDPQSKEWKTGVRVETEKIQQIIEEFRKRIKKFSL